jgi:hypothetical protein
MHTSTKSDNKVMEVSKKSIGTAIYMNGERMTPNQFIKKLKSNEFRYKDAEDHNDNGSIDIPFLIEYPDGEELHFIANPHPDNLIRKRK